MDSLPISLVVKGQPVLVVGGGHVALRKVSTLLSAGANVTVLANNVIDEIQVLAGSQLKIRIAEYHSQYLAGQRLVIAATDDLTVNQQVSDDASALGVWVNVVDQPDLCGFTFPAIVDRSPLTIAISSNGQSPVLVRLLKEQIEKSVPRWMAKFAELAGSMRDKVKQQLPHMQQRRHYWERVFRGKPKQFAMQQNWSAVQASMTDLLDNQQLAQQAVSQGKVYLVGGGPGDPDLLTIKALQVMQAADVIVYDALISDPVLALGRKDADYISVGKKAGNHSLPQDQINQLLVDLAKQGKVVCRLKGGDPYIFGRGGEEAELLVENKVQFEVVPGITAASACSAATGIPLTHREYAQSVQFVTGHCKEPQGVAKASGQHGVDWVALAKSNQTLVVYMGILRSGDIRQQLIQHGRASDTPVAIIEKGTRPDQRVVTGQLSELDSLVAHHQIGSPALVIIGEVVALHKVLGQPNEVESFLAAGQAAQPLALV